MNIIDPRIEKYLMDLTPEDDGNLLELERLAKERDFPIVDRLVGRLLFILAKLRDPKLVVELGSGFGYSALWFAKAIEKGKVILTDHSPENIDYARRTFSKAGLLRKAEFKAGDAIKIARAYKKIDILFIDIDKYQYLDAVKTLLPNLNRDALVIADNSLWYGRVTGRRRDTDTLGIKRFNSYMFANGDFFTTIVPIRDGVLVAYKRT